jgi:hypothetical protein
MYMYARRLKRNQMSTRRTQTKMETKVRKDATSKGRVWVVTD